MGVLSPWLLLRCKSMPCPHNRALPDLVGWHSLTPLCDTFHTAGTGRVCRHSIPPPPPPHHDRTPQAPADWIGIRSGRADALCGRLGHRMLLLDSIPSPPGR
jgi:hypothetical protein